MPMQAPIVQKDKDKVERWADDIENSTLRVNVKEGCVDKIRTNWRSHTQLTYIHWGNGGFDGT